MNEETHKIVNELVGNFESLKTARSNWENNWQEIAEFVLPAKAEFSSTRSPGERRRERIFDSTPIRSLTRFASGLHNTLTSSSLPWFFLKTNKPALDRQRPVQLWLEETTRILQDVFNRPMNNFHPAAHEYYLEQGAFGTGVMFIQDIPGQGPYYRTFPLSECFLDVNSFGRIDSLYRVYSHTARELQQLYDVSKMPEKVRTAIEKNNSQERFKCLHVVKPSKDYKSLPSRTSRTMPYMSVYVLMEHAHILNVSGFEEFPFVCSRWERNTKEIYGRGPGYDALSDIRMLNELEKIYLKGLQKIVDPALMMPDDGFLMPVRTTPGGINFYRSGMNPQDRIQQLPTPQRLEYAKDKLGQVRDAIGMAFYLDMLELPGPIAPDGDVMRFSATEIAIRQRDKLQVLGPIVARQEIEFLGPLIERTLRILGRNNMLPQGPEELMNAEIEVEYTNPVSIALRSSELASISQFLQFITPLGQIDPSVLRRINSSRLVEHSAEILRVPPSLLKTEQEVQQEMLREQQQQEMQAMMQQSALQNQQADTTAKQAAAQLSLAKADAT